MKSFSKILTSLLLLLTVSGSWNTTQAQMQIVFSDSFINGQSSPNQCTAWNAFKTQLTSRCYTSMTIRGTFDPVGQTCNDPAIVAAMAAALVSGNDYTSPSCGGNVWSLCFRYGGELWLNPPAQCDGNNCPTGYILRPCIGNSNWGGVNTPTCGGANQRQELIFEYLSGPTTNDTVSGPMTFCAGDTVTYSIDTVYDADTLTWSVPAGSAIISGQNSQSITVVMGSNDGTVDLAGINACGTSAIGSIAVTIPVIPNAAGQTITGADTVCMGDTLIYSIPAIPDAASYMWFPPSGATIVAGQGTNLISLVPGSTSGSLNVFPENSCAVSGAGDTLEIVVLPEATFSGPIAGPATSCESDTLMFIAGSYSNTTGLLWDVPLGWTIVNGQGTDTLWVVGQAGTGSIEVTAQGICGDGDTETISVSLDALLTAQGPISGVNAVCWGDTTTYSVPFNPAVTGGYNWVAPAGSTILSGQGDTLITVIWGATPGNISVTGSNLCGAGAQTDFAVTVDSCLVGIDGGQLNNGVSISPNPTSGEILVTFDIPMNGNETQIRIFDITGAAKGTVSANWSSDQRARINLGSLPAGVYFLEFQSGELRKTTKVVLSK